jgi:hypothetical protein
MPLAKIQVDVLEYLYPSRYCPSDRLSNIAMQQFGAMAARLRARAGGLRVGAQPHALHAGEHELPHLRLRHFQRTGGGLPRFRPSDDLDVPGAQHPARFVTGVDYGADPALGPMDFHAYVEVYLSGRWYIFDPTGICPTTGLIRSAPGRDASDVAFATIFGSVMWSAPKINVGGARKSRRRDRIAQAVDARGVHFRFGDFRPLVRTHRAAGPARAGAASCSGSDCSARRPQPDSHRGRRHCGIHGALMTLAGSRAIASLQM